MIKFIAIYVLNIIDLIATMQLVNCFGTNVEGNLYGKWLINNNCVYFIKIVVVALALFILYKFRKNKLASISTNILLIIYSLLAIYHIVIIIFIKRSIN